MTSDRIPNGASLPTTVARYREHCGTRNDIPLFLQAIWLDAVCGPNNWNVCLVERGGRIVGALPYGFHKILRQTFIHNPPLTPYLGPWIEHTPGKYATRLGYEKEIMTELIDQLPSFLFYRQPWHHSITSWLPFYWRGFSQTTVYTYIIDELSDDAALWANLHGNVRTDIRKAERNGIQVYHDSGLDALMSVNEKTFRRQGLPVPYKEDLVRRIDKTLSERDARKVLIARDQLGSIHAGAYIAYDDLSAYYLFGGGDPELRMSGAASLVLWEAIKISAMRVKCFDFEGSMFEQIERFFRHFGGRQRPYHIVSKIHPLAQALIFVRDSIRQLRSKR